LNLAETQIKEVLEGIKNNKKGYFADHGFATVLSFFINKILYGRVRKTNKFYTNEKCKSCGQCERICPSQAIKIKEKSPIWVEKKCSHCTACINRCPSQAIEYGNSTKKRKRYLNPYVKFDD